MDRIICATAADANIRVYFAYTKAMVNEAFEIHKTSPVVSAALGRLLTAGVIMGAMLKNDGDLVTLNIKSGGPIKGITVTSDNKGRVKGYPYNPMVEIELKPDGKLDVSRAVGEGTLSVIKDIGLKEPYAGQIDLVSGEIGDDLTHYFAQSEQTPTAIALGVLVDTDYSIRQAGGFLIQALPGADDELLAKLEQTITFMPPITTLLDEGKSIEDIMEMVLGEFGFTVNQQIEPKYYCNCNRDKVEKVLISIGIDDLEEICETDKKAELKCHFCNKAYLFSEDDIRKIIHIVQSK